MDHPIDTFKHWFSEAALQEPHDHTAATLATCSIDGRPHARIVLVKNCDENGLYFYTNYRSQKAIQLDEVPFAALVFHWPASGRQVRVEGRVKKTSAEQSDQYFAARPYGSQIGAWASAQSTPIVERGDLLQRVQEFEARFPNGPVPRPGHWGGYVVTPHRFEFWSSKEDRLHTRELFETTSEGWVTSKLFP